MAGKWTRSTTESRVRKALEGLGDIKIRDFRTDLNLNNIALAEAIRVDGVHLYVEFLNAEELLHSTRVEGERCHKRLLRYLHIYQRAVHFLAQRCDLTKVDFQNHRLHAVIYLPKDNDVQRILQALVIAGALGDLLKEANTLHAEIDDVTIAIGIESGMALAVRNGTAGDREPLFLGPAANQAAKLLANTVDGILLGPDARGVLGEGWDDGDPATAINDDELNLAREEAELEIDIEDLVAKWKDEVKSTPLKSFTFSRATPPLKNLDLDQLSPGSTKHMEFVTVFADVDGFSVFVADALKGGDEELVVRALHVIRKELRDILNDFEGLKIRYHGDCIQGVLAEGTSKTTDTSASVEVATVTAGAMRSAFAVIQDEISGLDSLGLAIGLDLGPGSLTRLGIRGKLDRCAVGRAMFEAERLQRGCDGNETAAGNAARRHMRESVAELFVDGVAADLDYNTVVSAIENDDEKAGEKLAAKPAANVAYGRAYTSS